MTTTFAIDVIQTFQPQDVEDFRHYLESPYCTKGYSTEALKPFFEILHEAIQQGWIEKVEKREVYHKLFPDKSFIESKIDKLMSDLKRLLEQFLLSQRYFSGQNEGRHLLDLCSEMRLRGLESRYHQTLEKTKKYANSDSRESLKTLFFRYLLAVEEQEWQSTYNKVKGDLNIPETIQRLDTYFFAHKTWMLNHLIVMQKITNQSQSAIGIGEEKWEVPHRLIPNSTFLDISWETHLLLKKQPYQAEDFQHLLQKIQSCEAQLSPENISELYTYLRNLCSFLIDSGHMYLYPTLHEIHKDNLIRKYFLQDGKISPNACLNITQIAIIVGATAWASEFLEQHKDIIIGETEDRSFYRMNKALCLFGERKYEQALEIIPFGSSYSYYHLMARRLELKIYYELRSDLLDHKIDAFKMFISRAGRKVFSGNLHELFTSFVNLVRQLSQSQGPQAKKRSQTLIKRISEKKMVAERLWLLEKAKELGEKR